MAPKKRSKRHSRIRKILKKLNKLTILQVSLILLICAAAWVLWLDHNIRLEFEGKKWSLPARVYASPLELYEGLEIDRERVESNLLAVGFERINRPNRPGEYAKYADKLVFVSRDFRFWDGGESSRKILLIFGADGILRISNVNSGKKIPLVRLEPELIGKIYPEHNEDRIFISYDEVPPLLINALIAIEDRNFFKHSGVDPRGILRAAFVNLRNIGLKQGGSTLTQQLVKNFFLSHERTFTRKFNEIIMSLLLEHHYSKQEILEAYINEIYLGQHGSQAIHGFAMASEYYFARRLNELHVDQLALLVALVRGASFYNPRKHPQRALERRNLVLEQMVSQEVLESGQAQKAMATPLGVVKTPGWSNAKYPDFLQLVRQQLRKYYKPEDLRSEGLQIFTTIIPAYQDIMEQAIQSRLGRLEQERNLPEKTIQAASLLTSSETGEVLALVGGRHNDNTGFNRVLNARRPIGSLVKPAVYLAALSQPEKYNVLSPLDDVPIVLKQEDGSQWSPDNYDGIIHDRVPLHAALENSYNLATIDLGMAIGIPRVKAMLRHLGVQTYIPEYPSLFLGSVNLTPYQVTQMYQTLASNGFKVPPRAIREVLNKTGEPLQRYPLDIEQKLDSRSVFIINFLLSQVVKQGTAKSLAARMPSYLPLAGKTGTSNDLRDSWYAGYGDNLLAVVWAGRDDNEPAGLTGAAGALQIWIDMMKKLPIQPLTLTPPDGVEWVNILDDHRVDENCSVGQPYPFISPYLVKKIGECRQTANTTDTESETTPWSIFDIFR